MMLEYNKKGFLLPESIRSCAMYHAKIYASGRYVFRVHDCLTGIRLQGDLNEPTEIVEAVEKLEVLGKAALDLATHIRKTHFTNENDHIITAHSDL